MPNYQHVIVNNPRVGLAEAVQHLNKHDATARLSIRRAVPLVVGSLNRGHFRLLVEGNRSVGFFCWALASREAARKWAFELDGSGVGDGVEGEGAVVNFLVCENADLVRYSRDIMPEIIPGKTFLCGRRSYKDGSNRPVWLDFPGGL